MQQAAFHGITYNTGLRTETGQVRRIFNAGALYTTNGKRREKMAIQPPARDMNLVIADNLKELRARQQLSLGEAAERTGVSKSMLGQIERGESSPTISTLWKIATGLHVSFTSLIEQPEQNIAMVHEADMTPLRSDGGRFLLYPIFQAVGDRNFELLDLELAPGAVSVSSPHAPGTEEFVLVYQGKLEISLGGDNGVQYAVGAGSAIHYHADQAHAYQNRGESVTKAAMVIYYPGK